LFFLLIWLAPAIFLGGVGFTKQSKVVTNADGSQDYTVSSFANSLYMTALTLLPSRLMDDGQLLLELFIVLAISRQANRAAANTF